jgi:hypothetical protein
MRTLTSTILSEQQNNNLTPRAKLEIKTFGYPVDPQEIRSDTFDWHLVYTNAADGWGHSTCASDGSLILTDGTTTTRFSDPQYDTDYSAWNAAGTISFNECIIGAPSTAGDPTEVMIIRKDVASGKLQYSQSTNYGTSFGAWTDICATNPMEIFV